MTPSPAASTSASDAGMLGRRVVMLPSAAAALGLRRGRARMRLGCVLEHVAPRLAVASAALLGAGEVIAAAAAAGKSGGAGHAAVASTLAQLTVTAVAIASGACLSTKVDFLWPRIEQLPDTLIFEGVEVTGYPIFEDPKVQKAIVFASTAHIGQFRKTGDPYVTHCIHTGKILAALVPSTGERAINTVVAGILHDVIDDTAENLKSIEEQFGDDVASLVSGVSKLSYINQVMHMLEKTLLSADYCAGIDKKTPVEALLLQKKYVLFYASKYFSYALPIRKAEAVAQETLAVWCSLASRLGVWALKAELEDLCFAVLQPHVFKKMRSELTTMWNSTNKTKSTRRSSIRSGLPASTKDVHTTSVHDFFSLSNQEKPNMKDLLQAVLPFDLLLDRKRRSYFLNNLHGSSETSVPKPKIVDDAAVALASLAACEEELEQELLISTSYIPGMEVTLSSRLKSLYSMYCKMKRKHVGIKQIYDARALRVIIGDKNGALHGPAVKNCYSVLDIVNRLWTPIDGEFDDYIINPKGSGYQSLHTAVQASDNSPLEVQIRTQRMHEYAEYGLAAHWLYKESKVDYRSGTSNKIGQSTSYPSSSSEDENYIQDVMPSKYSSMKMGHPVLRIEGSQLLAAVIVSIDKGGKELLVAVSFGLEASEAVAERRSCFQLKRWETYARVYKKVSEKWWCAPGHGDWSTNLEKYTLCQDGIFHKQDQFGRLLPTFIQLIDLTEEEEEEYWMVVSAIFEGKEASSLTPDSSNTERSTSEPPSSTPLSDPINNKVHLLRTMLQWEEQVRRGASLVEKSLSVGTCTEPILREVAIICWPYGKIMRMSLGSTAADAARRMGVEGKLLWVNGQLVLPQTELKDGDIVEVRM
ncbi:Os02g0699400 [Oryza sativa Japonica Group]|uniref:Os02g0699400 protein n=1 Tax=Oryza sativa subsp. japonica TaxID=39947 RepID=Q0DYE4_ORYSJ|nr:Os02g0699400 [Oryza sativa Japonica Group]|eukprot:NP_001047830.2 Os02g0699400 [Oryza sativa Japonica Group]